jgi:hypothetical protein
MAQHFEMVKSISTIYELASSVCENQAARGATSSLTAQYRNDVLRKDTIRWLEMFLHMADVSNPVKPFHVCQLWAARVLDEFFQQGDKEKEMGLPVGMLNDRDKVNRPGSQHGFITFLVSPLVVSAVKVFRPLYPLLDQLAGNLARWRDIWVSDARPPDEEVEKRDADIARLRETLAGLAESLVRAAQADRERDMRSPDMMSMSPEPQEDGERQPRKRMSLHMAKVKSLHEASQGGQMAKRFTVQVGKGFNQFVRSGSTGDSVQRTDSANSPTTS